MSDYPHWHWRNENERNGRKGFPWHGRAWLQLAARICLKLEWCVGRTSCALALDVDDENSTLHVAFPPLSLFFTVEAPFASRHYKKGDREIGVRVHDWTIWWRLWSAQDSWSSKTPRWRDGNWHFLDTLLGKKVLSKRVLKTCDVEVPMPERAYRGTATLEEVTWKRSRWFAEVFTRCEIEMADGEQVPFPGKGENSWDCGEDGIFSSGGPANTTEEAVGDLVASALRNRARYGRPGWRPARPLHPYFVQGATG